MTAFDRGGDPIAGAKAALESGTSVEAVCRIYGPAACRAHRVAALRRVLAAHDPVAADVAVSVLLAALDRQVAA